MRSIERRYRKISQNNICLSSLNCFKKAIEGQNFKKRTIRYWFLRLVEKDDYDRSGKREILLDLENLKPP
jgi:hypothetical protein